MKNEMSKEDSTQHIYEVNKYYFRLHSDKCFINEQMDFIYHTNNNIWYVYGSDFSGKSIDIAILKTEQIDEIKNWDVITKSKLFRYLLENKTPNDNKQSITYERDILKHFLPDVYREYVLNELL